MIKIVAKNYVKKDKIDGYIALVKKLVEATNREDAGCIHYQLYQDINNPGILTILEEWESQEALDKHMAAAHFKEIVPQLGAFTEKPGEVNLYKKV